MFVLKKVAESWPKFIELFKQNFKNLLTKITFFAKIDNMLY